MTDPSAFFSTFVWTAWAGAALATIVAFIKYGSRGRGELPTVITIAALIAAAIGDELVGRLVAGSVTDTSVRNNIGAVLVYVAVSVLFYLFVDEG